jgi:hypothetical protein
METSKQCKNDFCITYLAIVGHQVHTVVLVHLGVKKGVLPGGRHPKKCNNKTMLENIKKEYM